MIDTGIDEFRELARVVSDALVAYHQESASASVPVVRLEAMDDIARRLELERGIRDGDLLKGGFANFLSNYLAATTRLHHPAFMAHQVAVPHLAGGLGALIDGFTNNPMAVYEMGQAASSMEFAVINWMLEKIGWTQPPWPGAGEIQGPHGAGVLTHGGSLANLTALIAARRRLQPDVWQRGNRGRLGVMASPHAHYAVSRAVGIMGLGHDTIVPLPVDRRGVVDPDRLGKAHAQARRAGITPVALVANACSTAVGLYDPLRPIGEYCRAEGMWFHVDGAHGASALVSPRKRSLLDGVELADSVVWDAHKLLRTPALSAALLVRDSTDLEQAFQQEGSYLFHEKDQTGVDFAHLAVECTKAGLGLKTFFVLAATGEENLAAFIDRVYDMAHTAFGIIANRQGFECAVEPQSNIVCFRFGTDDATQLRLRDSLMADGRFHISSTEFNGARYLRLVIMNPATDETIIEALLDKIEELA